MPGPEAMACPDFLRRAGDLDFINPGCNGVGGFFLHISLLLLRIDFCGSGVRHYHKSNARGPRRGGIPRDIVPKRVSVMASVMRC